MDFEAIKVLVLDVDGVLTDGAIELPEEGPLTQRFSTQDGCALKLWQRAGHTVAIISGRRSGAVARRAAELGISEIRQGCGDKLAAYEALLRGSGATDGTVCYVGDDLPDLGPMRRCGLPVAVANAVSRVKQASGYVTCRPGGSGAVAEVIELILRKQRRWGRELSD
jgi:3-deoxy-D-manno-octulosonate 8-phosphate phosphatase (KDO 8-P phosphatase)